jgi:hypothetical protein
VPKPSRVDTGHAPDRPAALGAVGPEPGAEQTQKETGMAVEDVPQTVEEWRERAEQLQEALSSRIVIEQAKGVLRERLGLSVETAFELLRLAARGSRLKLHSLAADVVGSPSTPEAIVLELARRPDVFLKSSRDERILQTEDLFRRVNEAKASRAADDEGPFVCECANPYCHELLSVSAEDIEALHSRPNHYIVLPGHEVRDFEETLLAREGYVVVRKRETT